MEEHLWKIETSVRRERIRVNKKIFAQGNLSLLLLKSSPAHPHSLSPPLTVPLILKTKIMMFFLRCSNHTFYTLRLVTSNEVICMYKNVWHICITWFCTLKSGGVTIRLVLHTSQLNKHISCMDWCLRIWRLFARSRIEFCYQIKILARRLIHRGGRSWGRTWWHTTSHRGTHTSLVVKDGRG